MTKPNDREVEEVAKEVCNQIMRNGVLKQGHKDVPLIVEAITQQVKLAMEPLREALIQHRGDLHEGSKRPCPTCKKSAIALGIDGLVPDHCSRIYTDREALTAYRNKWGRK